MKEFFSLLKIVLKKLFYTFLRASRNILRKIYVWHILSKRKNWYRSKKGNFYNPTFNATAYQWNDKWNVARFAKHHEGYHSKQDAQEAAFQMWLEERGIELPELTLKRPSKGPVQWPV